MMSIYGLPKKVKAYAVSFSALLAFGAADVVAQTMADYSTLPRSLDQGVAPMVMLAMSNDHQLYFKAYTDYDDLNNNGDLEADEINYSDTRSYAGYFSNKHCYTHNNGELFEITSAAEGANNHFCSGAAEWSGNFLNWATMTRIDVLRYVLYGGLRATDDADKTVLERSYLPNDAHSFAKYYNQNDLANLTPFSNSDGGEQGITICNTTLHTGANQAESKSNTNPPLMRVVKGNFGLWASGERYQCLFWGHEVGENGMPPKNENGEDIFNDVVNEGLKVGPDRRGKSSPDATKNAAAITAFTTASGGDFIPVLDSPNFREVNEGSHEGSYAVRIDACPNDYANDIEGCKRYGEIYKPTGLLHTSGANGDVLYGLLTGSYESNKQGGYLRKNIGVVTDEINAATGQFIAPTEGGIIQTLNSLRIAGWRESDGTAWNGDDNPNNDDGAAYNETDAGGNIRRCKWGRIGFDNGSCVDWGNPLGEILAESYRYFAGIDGEVNEQNTTGLEGDKAPVNVKKAKWSPLTEDKYSCANMNVIGLNTSAQTFETQLDTFAAGLSGASRANINTVTNSLLSPGRYFVGDATGGDTLRANISCAAKTLTNLSDAIGPCPDSPGLEGTWRAAGLAKIVSGRADIAVEEDVNESDDGYDLNNELAGDQRVTTHGLQLATTLPLAKINYDGRPLIISPMCESWGDADKTERPFLGNCALVDFKVLSKTTTSGAFYVNWEDSEQGGDYDQDMHGILSYEIDGNMLKVTTKVIGQSTSKRLGFGYVLAGVGDGDDQDGVYVNSGVNGYPGDDNYKYPGCNDEDKTAIGYTAYQNKKFYVNGREDQLNGQEPILFAGCGLDNEAHTKSHIIDAQGSDADRIPPVLQLAAEGAGGQFVNVNDPEALKAELNSIIGNLGPKPVAGGGEVAASGGSGGNKLYLHTTYYSQRENAAGDRVNWVGQVGALHIDTKGRLREDTPGDGRTTGTLDATDYIIRFSKTLKDANDQPVVEKYSLTAEGEAQVEGPFTFDDINYIWNATDRLAGQAAQADGRKIYTALPPDLEAANIDTDVVKRDELLPFNADTFSGLNSVLLGSEPEAVIAYIQGSNDDAAGTHRSRTLDNKKYLLGDVLTSPVIQGRPDYTYAIELGDPTYKEYQDEYSDAPKIAYVAANDGLIHAFYAAAGDTPLGDKPLGEELWAYAPFNLLPHLQWLPNKRYSHVPYYDGYMRTFDVKAFSSEDPDIYPGGWGTILVVGTGLGGGAYDIDLDGTNEVTTRPAYIVLDITDRNAEQPKLIAEISHEQLGFTTGEPDVARFKENASDADEAGNWFLVFGSGPRGYDQQSARGAQQSYTLGALPEALEDTPELNRPHLFAFNLNDKTTLTTHRIADADPMAFVGGVNSMDWDRDFADDMLYFGTVAGTQEAPSGKLWRAKVALGGTGLSFEPSVMFNTQKPVAKRPATVIDYRNNYWVFAGTGRYYVRSDAANNNSGNRYLGLKEQRAEDGALAETFSAFTDSTLFNSTGVTIRESGALENAEDKDGEAINYIDGLRKEIAENKDGWYINFGDNERQHTGTGYAASTLFFSTTVPGASESCSSGDQGYVYLIDMRSGVFSPFYKPLASSGDNQNNGVDVDSVLGSMEVVGSGPVLEGPYPPTDVWNLGNGAVQDGPEPIEFKSQRHSWREVQAPW